MDLDHDGKRWVYKVSTRPAEAVQKAGGRPVLISPDDTRSVDEILDEVDGFFMSGGDDLHPTRVGRDGIEERGLPMRLVAVRRESFVLRLAEALLRRSIPALCVCLGAQALNAAAGGDIYLDIPSELPSAIEHRNGHEHRIIPEPDGLLFRYWRGQPQNLQSHHHQAVRSLGDGLSLEARAEDGVIEAFRATSHSFLLGVQWHPEVHPESPGGLALVQSLVAAARGME